jgi:hypothetical protein
VDGRCTTWAAPVCWATCPVEVVVAAEAFFPPDVVRTAWEEGRALVAPADAARFYAELCADHARSRFADDADTARAVELVERVVDAAPYAGLPLFVGWRALPRPTDAPAGSAAAQLPARAPRLGARGGGGRGRLGPLEAIVAGSYGEANARFFEWPEPYPDPDATGARWDAART